MNPAMSTSTVAVIVTYNPDANVLREILASLAQQCPVVIVDNGSSLSALDSIGHLIQNTDSVDLIKLDENKGIAHAQNMAIRHIQDSRPATGYLLTLDHDSIPPDGMVACLESTFETLAERGFRVAAVGPVLYDPRDDKLLKLHKTRFLFPGKIRPETVTGNPPAVEVDGLNSSGTLMSTEAFQLTGEFDSALFIDHVETDWCFRARAKGFRLFATTATRLTHHMGDDVCYYWFLGRKCMPYRSPSRHYYLARNSMLLQKRDYIPASWKISNILKLCFTLLYFGFLGNDRKRQRKCILQGIRDGLRGITGKSRHPVRE